ncbi:pyrroloquinoline quinone biosynthesis protein PqqB [Kutzneria viridogrisea]|uniref:Coenzyme PQQ synthesis protein B n=1 Tax=Kutzneria viridogrisea TaxID=47990 RepID=A0ABR6BSK2_9PSEU|nr:pyrroloquinoline quinone biosynthesis protein B [Kutzneria viridogrisea]
MKVLVLGTAAGGGFPQWNCACAQCAKVRAGALPARTQDCLAVSGNGQDWWLLNASPDIRGQLVSAPEFTPGPGRRDTPLRGVLLTDAELDHTLGLFVLREGGGQQAFAPRNALDALRADLGLRAVLDRYAGWTWTESLPGKTFDLAGGLRATPVPVGSKRPKYAGQSTVDDTWVLAYRVEDPATGGVLVYAPCLASWPEGLLIGASIAFVDGTFARPDEMGAATGSSKGQSAMGHLPMLGPGGSLEALRRHPGVRRIYTHLNNTNPALDPDSAERAQLTAAGVEIVPDGTVLNC